MAEVPLTVLSYNGRNVTSSTQSFTIDKIEDLRANMNKASDVTITPAGDKAGIMSAWYLYGKILEGQILHWTVDTVTGTTRRVRIYNNTSKTKLLAEGTKVIANAGNGVVFLEEKNHSGIYGQVTITLAGAMTDDTDVANLLTLTKVTEQSNFQTNGESQFEYIADGIKKLVTVSETVTQVRALIDAIQS